VQLRAVSVDPAVVDGLRAELAASQSEAAALRQALDDERAATAAGLAREESATIKIADLMVEIKLLQQTSTLFH
jgi:hypothetical protein